MPGEAGPAAAGAGWRPPPRQQPDNLARSARASRAFLKRTVRWLAREEAVPPGSYLVISHPASDLEAESMAEMTRRLNAMMSQRVVLRSHAEVTAFFGGLEIAEPGVVRAPEWRPDSAAEAAAPCMMWGGVGGTS